MFFSFFFFFVVKERERFVSAFNWGIIRINFKGAEGSGLSSTSYKNIYIKPASHQR